MARIVMQLVGGKLREHSLGRVTHVGRHPDQDVQVLDPLVSKAHVVIERIADDWYLRDLDSRNGTWVNGGRVEGRVPLMSHDRVRIGATHFIFHATEARRVSSDDVRIGDRGTGENEVARLRESATEFLPVDLVPNEAALKRDYERLRIAHFFMRQLGEERRLEVLLPAILEHIFSLFNADRGTILLRNDDGDLVPRGVAERGPEVDRDRGPIVLTEALLEVVEQSKQAVLSRDGHTDAPLLEGAGDATRSSMTAPLVGRLGDVGVLHVDSLRVANAFSERDLGTFLVLAGVIARVVEAARGNAHAELDASTRLRLSPALAPLVIDRVLRGELRLLDDVDPRAVAVLWLELRTSRDGPETGFVERLVETVHAFEGTVERVRPDCLVAVWNAVVPANLGPARAQRCAVALYRILAETNTLRALEHEPPIVAGLGLDLGPAQVTMPTAALGGGVHVSGAPMHGARTLANAAVPGRILASDAARAEAPTAAMTPWTDGPEGAPRAWLLTTDHPVRHGFDRMHTLEGADFPPPDGSSH
jgi:adenylate cyclase